MLQRNRYQRGSVMLYRGRRMKVWYGMWREDVIGANGQVRRRQRNQRLGSMAELPTKADAREALRKLIGNSDAKVEMKFSELAESFITVQVPTMKRSSGYYATRRLRGPLTKQFGGWDISRIGRFEIESFFGQLSSKYSQATLRGLRSALSVLMEWAVGCGWIEKNPAKGAKLPRTCGGRRVTRTELSSKLVAAMVGKLEEPYASLVLLLYTTGLRIGEAIAIRHEDLLADGCLHIRRRLYEGEVDTVKTSHSERLLPIPETLLSRLKGLSREGWIFQARNGSPLNPGNVLRREVSVAARAVGIEKLNWHSFRHSFTAEQRRLGTHPKVISGLLGHSKVQLAMDVYDSLNRQDTAPPLDQLLRSVMKEELAA